MGRSYGKIKTKNNRCLWGEGRKTVENSEFQVIAAF